MPVFLNARAFKKIWCAFKEFFKISAKIKIAFFYLKKYFF